MKYFGTVDSFDINNGRGSIKPETGGENLVFEKSAFSWDIKAKPKHSFGATRQFQRQPSRRYTIAGLKSPEPLAGPI